MNNEEKLKRIDNYIQQLNEFNKEEKEKGNLGDYYLGSFYFSNPAFKEIKLVYPYKKERADKFCKKINCTRLSSEKVENLVNLINGLNIYLTIYHTYLYAYIDDKKLDLFDLESEYLNENGASILCQRLHEKFAAYEKRTKKKPCADTLFFNVCLIDFLSAELPININKKMPKIAELYMQELIYNINENLKKSGYSIRLIEKKSAFENGLRNEDITLEDIVQIFILSYADWNYFIKCVKLLKVRSISNCLINTLSNMLKNNKLVGELKTVGSFSAFFYTPVDEPMPIIHPLINEDEYNIDFDMWASEYKEIRKSIEDKKGAAELQDTLHNDKIEKESILRNGINDGGKLENNESNETTQLLNNDNIIDYSYDFNIVIKKLNDIESRIKKFEETVDNGIEDVKNIVIEHDINEQEAFEKINEKIDDAFSEIISQIKIIDGKINTSIKDENVDNFLNCIDIKITEIEKVIVNYTTVVVDDTMKFLLAFVKEEKLPILLSNLLNKIVNSEYKKDYICKYSEGTDTIYVAQDELGEYTVYKKEGKAYLTSIIVREELLYDKALKFISSNKLGVNPSLYFDGEIFTKFEDIIRSAHKSLYIINPWVSQYIMDKYYGNLIKSATRRGVKVYITYGYLSKGSDLNTNKQNEDKLMKSKEAVEKLQLSCNNIFSGQDDTHIKAVVIDERDVFIGSCNFMNYRHNYSVDPDYRHEIMMYISDPEMAKILIDYSNKRIKTDSI